MGETGQWGRHRTIRRNGRVCRRLSVVRRGRGSIFFPLTVDYRERSAAAGKFPGGFLKREGRPTLKEILTSRLVDRPVRPLFPEGYADEVQIMATFSPVTERTTPTCCRSSVPALPCCWRRDSLSGALSAVRVGMANEQFTLMPKQQSWPRAPSTWLLREPRSRC